MDTVTTSPATDDKPVVKKSISAEQYVAQRSKAMTPEAPPKEEAKAETAKEEAKPKDEAKVEKPAAEAPSKDVLSQLDLGELTEEDIAELAQKGKSGLLKRVAELTAKRKVAEERLAHLEQEVARQAKPMFEEAKVENNPYAAISDVATLNTKYTEIREVIEWAEEVLDRSDGLSGGDVAATVDGKELTKTEIREHLRKARKAQEKYLPAQFKELQAGEQRKALRTAFDTRARQELPWIEGEDNEMKKNFNLMLSDPRLKKLEEAIPDLAPQMGYILAHASNSMFGRKEIPLDAPATKPNIRATPPSNPSTSSAGSSRGEDKEERAASILERQLQKSGSVSDYVAMRTAQISKRKLIKT